MHTYKVYWTNPGSNIPQNTSCMASYLSSLKTNQIRRKRHVLYSYLQQHNDKDAGRTSLEKYSPLTLLQGFERVVEGFACERMLETERKLHILTPLVWPSRCVFLVLLDAQPEVLGSTPSGLFRGPPRSGVAFPTTSGLYCLEVCWQLHRGFPRSPEVGCGLPYHIWSLAVWNSAGNCIGDPKSTELNDNSTPTRSPTGSLKSNV